MKGDKVKGRVMEWGTQLKERALTQALTPDSSPLSPRPRRTALRDRPSPRRRKASTPLGLAANQREVPRRSDYLSPRRQINAPLIKKYVPSQLKGHTSLVALEVCHIPFNAALLFSLPPPTPRLGLLSCRHTKRE